MNPFVNGTAPGTPYRTSVLTAGAPAEPEAETAYEGESEEDILAEARRRFDLCAEAESELRLKLLEDLEFYSGEGQWEDNIKAARLQDKRPCLTINRLPQSVHQVTNQIRKDKPAAKISPVDDQGDIKTAEILQGLIRHIEQQSNAPAVRSYASFYSVVCGRGYYRIVTEYSDPMSFDQEIYIRRIKNPLTVYMDPSAQEPDYSDARYCFIIEDLTDEEFKAQYPGKELASAESFSSTGDSNPIWRYRGGVRVAEYFCRKERDVEIAMLPDGSARPLAEIPEGVPILATRTARVPYVYWKKIDGAQILESREWPGRYIPVVAVLGEEFDIDGSTELAGMVRNAKDPQRMLNYWESAKTETIALAPRVPFIVAEGQLENHEKEWAQANTRNYAYLQYKPKSVGQELVPPPQRQVYEPPVQAITVAQAQTVDHLKATTGIYDASLGNRSNETTGVAIRQRQVQGDTANYHYIDNLATAVTHETRILIDLIPKIYDRPGRVARIIGEDGSAQTVPLNVPFNDQGIQRIYDLQTGRYDVAVNIGPSYATKRQESADSMLGFAQAAPELVPRYADLFVQAQDWPGAQEIADRVRPPDIPPPGEQQIPPQAQQKIQQLTQQNEQLTMAVTEMSKMIEAKQLEWSTRQQMQTEKLASDQQIAAEKNRTTLVTKAAELQTQEGVASDKNTTSIITKAIDTDSRDSIALLSNEVLSIAKRLEHIAAMESARQRGQQRPER